MALRPGDLLGPYEILSPLGAGAMAEVYRARDQRLGRDVALKVIVQSHAHDPEHVRRFEQEARALASLAHPHILAVFDIGTSDGTLYVVSELLEGMTVRQRLQDGPLPVRRAVELTVEACRGLGAAHAQSIVHRDLKPENLFITKSGHLKILDFGVAKLLRPEPNPVVPGASQAGTAPGLLVGTVGYMSPEQARGEDVDARSDLFAIGAILYEMVTGRRAFQAPTGVDTLATLLTREPPEMAAPTGPVPASLEQVVRRCLQKDRDERFQSARDVAYAMEALLAVPTTGAGQMRFVAPPVNAARRWLIAACVVAGLAAAGAVGRWSRAPNASPSPPAFRQLTFREGWINYARFTSDGRTVLYTAAWNGQPPEVFSTRTDTRESRPLGFPHAALLSVSSTGQLAILLDPLRGQGLFAKGTLATAPLGGGAPPRELLENVLDADWTPDGRELAVLLEGDGEQRIELPAGNLLYRSSRGLRLLRASPDGKHLAFIEGTGSSLALTVLERATGKVSVLAPGLPANLFGLAWAPGSREVWFCAGDTAAQRDILAVDLDGVRRIVYRSLVTASLLDIAPDGRALLHRGFDRWGTRARLEGTTREEDLSVFDASVPASLSADGKTVLLYEFSEAAGPGAVYVARGGATPAVRISDGVGWDVSPDGHTALVRRGEPTRLFSVPDGAGLERPLVLGTVSPRWGKWVPPDARRVVLLGNDKGRPLRLWVAGTDEAPRAIGPESRFTFFAVAPDGTTVAARLAADTVDLLPLEGGAARTIRGVARDLEVGSYTGDGRGLFLVRTSVSVPCEVHRLDLASERVAPWLRVAPADITGISQCAWMNLSADGRSYAYAYFQALGDLFLAEGLK